MAIKAPAGIYPGAARVKPGRAGGMLSSTLTTSHGWSLARRSCAWCQKQGVSFNFTCKKCGESFSLCNRVCQKELVRVHECAAPGQRSLVDDSLPMTLAYDSLGGISLANL